jgi:hypothetical protein
VVKGDQMDIGKAILLIITASLIGLLSVGSDTHALLPDKGERMVHLYEVGEKADLYYYENANDRCYMLIGQLHGKTVSISCVKK